MSKKRKFGLVTLTLTDVRTGKMRVAERHNLVVNNGEQWIARRVNVSPASTAMKWIEVGRGSLAATSSQTQLQTTLNISTVRKQYTTQDVSGATWNIIVNYGTSDANTSNIKEAGIFGTSLRASTVAPGMLARTVFAAVNKTNSDTLKIQWQINFDDDHV